MPVWSEVVTRPLRRKGTERAKVTTMPIQLNEEKGGCGFFATHPATDGLINRGLCGDTERS